MMNPFFFKYFKLFIGVFCMMSLMNSCKIYSFTGASIPEGITTFSVQNFTNKASNAPVVADRIFTEMMRQKFTGESGLRSINTKGDLDFFGYVSSYNIAAISPTAGTYASKNRMTITIKVLMTSKENKLGNWETIGGKDFTDYEDYENSENLLAVQESLIRKIYTKIISRVFTDSIANW